MLISWNWQDWCRIASLAIARIPMSPAALFKKQLLRDGFLLSGINPICGCALAMTLIPLWTK